MQSNSQVTMKAEKETHGWRNKSYVDIKLHEPGDFSSSQEEDESCDKVDTSDQHNDDLSKDLVLYNPSTSCGSEIQNDVQPIQCLLPEFGRPGIPNTAPRVLPSVGAFTVQCASCFKWRLIPTKEKYEAIREQIIQQPFHCETAREWRPDISCDEPTDISQDGSRIWAIDKPNIAKPPPGWQRLLRIRGEGSTKFADVYYQAPSGKRLRSMVEVQKFLAEHPEYTKDGVALSQFSFQTPKPLQENYVRKRPPKLMMSCGHDSTVEISEVRPLSWVAPQDVKVPQFNNPAVAPPLEDVISDHAYRPAKKQVKRAPTKQINSDSTVCKQHDVKIEQLEQTIGSHFEKEL